MASPTAADVLAWIEAETPWFPARKLAVSDPSRPQIENILDELRRAQLIEARDWVKGSGQGFGLTESGQRARKDAAILSMHLSGESADTLPFVRQSPTTYDRGERARDAYYKPQPPVVTQLLVLLNLAVFLIGLGVAWRSGSGRMAFLNGQDLPTLVKLGAVSGEKLVQGEWWRLGSANFVHVGVMHLILNILCLAIVGGLAENLWGRWRFALIYLIGGLGGASLAMMIQPNAYMAGASGAVWGVMASLAVWLVQYRQHFPADEMRDFARRLAMAIILNAAFSFVPDVSWEGHLGGALAGMLMAIALDAIRRGYPRRTRAGIVAAVGIPIAIVALLLLVATRAEAWRRILAQEATLQQIAYRLPVRAELIEVDRNLVNQIHLETLRLHSVPIAHITDFEKRKLRLKEMDARAQALLAKATAIAARVPTLPAPRRYAADAPRKLLEYLTAVQEFAKQTSIACTTSPDDFTALTEARDLVEARWTALAQNRWQK